MPDIDAFLAPFRITDGSKFRLSKHDPRDTNGFDISKAAAKAKLDEGISHMREMQEKLFAQNEWSILLIFQAMDAAGKDGAIKHVMSGINPQGCQVHPFKAPSDEELDHDFLWRTTCRLPERGRIGIFNRSYYEEVLVVRVHPEILARQRLPMRLVTGSIWDERLKDICLFEDYLSRNGTKVLKFFLNVSKEEQKKRLIARIDDPSKNWKFDVKDVDERQHWDAYMQAYEAAIRATATEQAPWYVVPADDKWFTRVTVMAAIISEMRKLDLAFPLVSAATREKLAGIRKALEND
ncbi:polyphosphate kinase 2 family protein [Chelatococcus sp. XZ-Ab1]|uniref:polyphosphate kinase 2 family protein n=1 Tax=Chelatococcus sp. XZ-Ab1 TaxID=3034027 RepID=UPI0023E457C1|nr:polyphosphate kinase 2 family protein [Chelatococcus sp. XZ-Ab1]